jgi:hypothetical protein
MAMTSPLYCLVRWQAVAWAVLGSAALIRGATVVVPGKDVIRPPELQAAVELSRVLTIGGVTPATIRNEDSAADPHEVGPWIYLGETVFGRINAPLPPSLEDDGFRIKTLQPDRIILRGATPAATVLAVDWYAQHAMAVRWFIPGPLGEVIPSLRGWTPPAWDRVVAPTFGSREFQGLETDGANGDAAGSIWGHRNGLLGHLPHGHALAGIFPPKSFASHPNWFPLLDGERYQPQSVDDYNWQPNLALPAVADHAAEEANRYFDHQPDAAGFSLSINDSIRFDQSSDTMRARGPLRWFRGRPDYSDLVFAFMNRVADSVGQRHPNKLLSAYAYYWCENLPTFPVRANVVPWLTADRSQWFDPDFRATDCALIERWCHSGAGVIGLYDYFYGAPFLVPRVTTTLTADSIQYSAQAGVKAFFAETNPNWALDGPKLWIATQLLWNSNLRLGDLQQDYYHGFWAESAAPMRKFYDRCERAWSEQQGSEWWLKYYGDEAQADLFPPQLCQELRTELEVARRLAKSDVVRQRVEMVSAGFTVTERFVAFSQARDVISRSNVDPHLDQTTRRRLAMEYQVRKTALIEGYNHAMSQKAIAPMDLRSLYLRDDPSNELTVAGGDESGLLDQEWHSLHSPRVLDDRTFTWSIQPWFARGEPVEGRCIQMTQSASGTGIVTYRGCKAERIQQWVSAVPGKVYVARVLVKGIVASGSQTYLVLNWKDQANRYVGRSVSDRLPTGDWQTERPLVAIGQAPPNVRFVGVGVFVANQTGRDVTAFSKLSLTMAAGSFSAN